MKFKNLLPVFFLLSPFIVFSQTIDQKISSAYSKFKSDRQFQYAAISLTVLDAESGNIIFSENGNLGLAPASTLKTVTSATAFHLLGQDYTWKTLLQYSGTITKNGELTGDLILQGSGDPALGSDRYDQSKAQVMLERWTEAVHKAGIKKISGRIIADDHLFGTQIIPGGWIWQDIGNYYGAGSSSVVWNENQFDLIFSPGLKPGEPAKLIRTVPDMSYLTIVNEVTTGEPGSGDNVYAFSSPYSNIVYLRGTYGIDLKKTIAGSIPDPGFEAAYRLKQALISAGIKIESEPETSRRLALSNEKMPPVNGLLDSYSSPGLSRIVYWLNKKSINLYAENLAKTIAFNAQKPANTENGIEIIKKYWTQTLNIDSNSLDILDGSGLSPEDRVTTSTIARILQSVQKEEWFDKYYESFPVYNNMKMKSGSMRNVLAYAGYQTAASGRKAVFSLIVNNYNGSTSAVRQKMFALLDQLK